MNEKTGIANFLVGVDFFHDIKIVHISNEFGLKGEAITMRLFCEIYRQGYYMDWDKDAVRALASQAKCTHNFVKEVVGGLLKCDVFHKPVFENFAVLTSRGIQKRYFSAMDRMKRKCDVIRESLLLIDASAYSCIPSTPDKLKKSMDIKQILQKNSRKTGTNYNSNKDIKTFYTVANATLEKNKTKPPTFDHTSTPYVCAKYLADKLLQANPNATNVPQTDEAMYKWCDHINWLITENGKPEEEVLIVLRFAVNDSFWRGPITSTKIFRKNYDKIYSEMKRQTSNHAVTRSKSRFANFAQRNNDNAGFEHTERLLLMREYGMLPDEEQED